MKIKLAGHDEKLRGFASLSEDIEQPADLFAEAGRLVRSDARRIAPKRTGRLAASINVRKSAYSTYIRTRAPYAQFVHYGSKHNPRPIPFLDLALARNEQRIERIADDAVDKAIIEARL